jgi:peptidoglycan/LPS O-acetylase OafA/YrhL
MAVTLFFVVSGFLMSLILTEKYASRGRFYLNRLLRIFPPFWCAVIFTITIGVIIPSGFFREVVSNISAYYESGNLWATAYAATANTLLFGSAIGRRLGSPDYVDVIYSVAGRPEHSFNRMLFVPQAWTLPVELGFFIFWHPLYCALERRPYSFCAPASS